MKKIILLLIIFLLCLQGLTLDAQQEWSRKKDFGGAAKYGAVAFTIGSKAYLIAGRDAVNRKDVWQYDASKNVWTQKANFPGAGRYQAIAFSIGNRGYVGTGAAGASFPFSPVYNDLWEYDPTSDSWTQKTSLPGVARFGAVAFTANNKAYLGSGFTDGFPYFLNDFWEFDPNDLSAGLDAHGNPMGVWKQKNNFGGPVRMEAVAFTVNNKGYVTTGGNYMNGTLLYNDCWEYDPALDTWTQKSNFGGVGRSLATGFTIGEKAYVGIGGDFSSASYPDFWEFDPADISNGFDVNNNPLGVWTQVQTFAGTSRWLATAFSIADTGYITTGGNFTPTYKDLWSFGPKPAAPSTVDIGSLKDFDISVKIYPSVSSGDFILSGVLSDLQLSVITLSGEKVAAINVGPSNAQINLSSLANGIYIVQIQNEKEIKRGKIVIAK